MEEIKKMTWTDFWYDLALNSGVALWFAMGVILLLSSSCMFAEGELVLWTFGDCFITRMLIGIVCVSLASFCAWGVNQKIKQEG